MEQNRLQGWVLNDPCTATIFHLLWSPFTRFSPQQSCSSNEGQYIVNTWEASFSVQHECFSIGKRTRNLRFECYSGMQSEVLERNDVSDFGDVSSSSRICHIIRSMGL
jgi:hypothetical protein